MEYPIVRNIVVLSCGCKLCTTTFRGISDNEAKETLSMLTNHVLSHGFLLLSFPERTKPRLIAFRSDNGKTECTLYRREADDEDASEGPFFHYYNAW